MAKRENHDKRTDLYAKALNGAALNQVRSSNKVLGAHGEPVGIFIVKPSSVSLDKDGRTFVSDSGGTKWLPPKNRIDNGRD